MIQEENFEKNLDKETKIDKNFKNEIKKNNIEIQTKKKEIDILKKDINNVKLRYYATLDNIKKNTTKEIKIIKKMLFKNFFKKLYPILLQFKKFLHDTKKKNIDMHPIVKGLKLTQKSFQKNFKIWKIKEINQSSIKYDPNIHILENKDPQLNKSNQKFNLVKIIKHGYMIQDEVIKKAIVKII
ncbi:nucleotide exchange factor GrpE [Buchnera aphidicola]|uniref:Protein GrpE n=1 Tax=Buchnera aphidicola subsp. Tuberolachnus salignus TaxID=98804 RepID=A0A160SWU7_BUCTT|nr:nucleotide exchange factor GrpE [Buchnera aphidicola]CUR53108.1 Protein GrpE [Buchnera aphidicola (Tuberolachnus salignus)]